MEQDQKRDHCEIVDIYIPSSSSSSNLFLATCECLLITAIKPPSLASSLSRSSEVSEPFVCFWMSAIA